MNLHLRQTNVAATDINTETMMCFPIEMNSYVQNETSELPSIFKRTGWDETDKTPQDENNCWLAPVENAQNPHYVVFMNITLFDSETITATMQL